jgi:hypothetical protein
VPVIKAVISPLSLIFTKERKTKMTAPTFNFPHPTLTPIANRPSTATLNLLKKEIYANAMSKPSILGGGNHGFLALVMSPNGYAQLNGTIPFIDPVHPGAQAAHPAGATGPQMTESNRKHDYDLTTYVEFAAMRDHLKGQLIAAVHETYIQILSDEIFGFANVIPRDIMEHLMLTYGVRTVEDLETNRDKIKSDWNPDTEIEHLWKRAADCKAFADGTALALTDDAIMNLLLIPIEKSKVLQDDVKEAWRLMDPVLQTWTTFKTHFERANKERNRTLRTGTAGYHALAAATAGLQLTEHSANAATATQATQRRDNTTSTPTAPHADGGDGIKLYYCHSCGLSPNRNHTSETCGRPKEGHQTTATLRNMMNGSTTFRIARPNRTRTNARSAQVGGTTPTAPAPSG